MTWFKLINFLGWQHFFHILSQCHSSHIISQMQHNDKLSFLTVPNQRSPSFNSLHADLSDLCHRAEPKTPDTFCQLVWCSQLQRHRHKCRDKSKSTHHYRTADVTLIWWHLVATYQLPSHLSSSTQGTVPFGNVLIVIGVMFISLNVCHRSHCASWHSRTSTLLF